jgi:DNA-binding transcriptional ArsR family regulator
MDSLTALADPTRRQIVELLAKGEHAAGEITERFAISAPAISQHLKILREAGLVTVRVDRQRRIYRLDPAGLGAIDAWLRQVRQFWNASLDDLERELREAAVHDRERDRK